MLRIIQAEFMKTRRNNFFTLSGLIAFCYPLLITVKDLLQGDNTIFDLPLQTWVESSQDIFLSILLFVLSGLVVTSLFQKEYSERTIIGQLTSPISRTGFLSGKLVVWASFHMLMVILALISTCAGAMLLYPGELTFSFLLQATRAFLIHGLLVFLSMLPLMTVAVLQKSLFYPSTLISLLFTLIASCTMVLPRSLVFTLPWSAARTLGLMMVPAADFPVAVGSVLICALTGLISSLLLFRRQPI